MRRMHDHIGPGPWRSSRRVRQLLKFCLMPLMVSGLAAQDNGWFDGELMEGRVPQRRGDDLVVSADEGPRRGTSLEKLAKLRAAFRKGGSVTAGNSSMRDR